MSPRTNDAKDVLSHRIPRVGSLLETTLREVGPRHVGRATLRRSLAVTSLEPGRRLPSRRLILSAATPPGDVPSRRELRRHTPDILVGPHQPRDPEPQDEQQSAETGKHQDRSYDAHQVVSAGNQR